MIQSTVSIGTRARGVNWLTPTIAKTAGIPLRMPSRKIAARHQRCCSAEVTVGTGVEKHEIVARLPASRRQPTTVWCGRAVTNGSGNNHCRCGAKG